MIRKDGTSSGVEPFSAISRPTRALRTNIFVLLAQGFIWENDRPCILLSRLLILVRRWKRARKSRSLCASLGRTVFESLTVPIPR